MKKIKRKIMKITRRSFLKKTLTAAALSCLPTPLIALYHAKTTAAVRELKMPCVALTDYDVAWILNNKYVLGLGI
jgi:hypothetical protein